jgi:hypothetical protein
MVMALPPFDALWGEWGSHCTRRGAPFLSLFLSLSFFFYLQRQTRLFNSRCFTTRVYSFGLLLVLAKRLRVWAYCWKQVVVKLEHLNRRKWYRIFIFRNNFNRLSVIFLLENFTTLNICCHNFRIWMALNFETRVRNFCIIAKNIAILTDIVENCVEIWSFIL